MVKMLQDVKLVTEKPNQFLGDLFEGFLDDGIKQSEGQFFTPTPIVRFLVSTLPLEEMIKSKGNHTLKMLDYACGAGHFLNEYARRVKEYLPDDRITEYYGSILGIEKNIVYLKWPKYQHLCMVKKILILCMMMLYLKMKILRKVITIYLLQTHHIV